MCISLLSAFCKFFDCEIKDLQKFLSNPVNKSKLISKFQGTWLRTTYKNRAGVRHVFQFGGLTLLDAKHVKAYNNFLGVTVLQHYYSRHRIYLKLYNLPCVIENMPQGDVHYFPIELLEIVQNECPCREETIKDKNEKDQWKLYQKVHTYMHEDDFITKYLTCVLTSEPKSLDIYANTL